MGFILVCLLIALRPSYQLLSSQDGDADQIYDMARWTPYSYTLNEVGFVLLPILHRLMRRREQQLALRPIVNSYEHPKGGDVDSQIYNITRGNIISWTLNEVGFFTSQTIDGLSITLDYYII